MFKNSTLNIHQLFCFSIKSRLRIFVSFLDCTGQRTLYRRTRNPINLIITPSVPLCSLPPLCARQLFVQIIVEIHLQYKDDYHNNAYKHPAPYGIWHSEKCVWQIIVYLISWKGSSVFLQCAILWAYQWQCRNDDVSPWCGISS